MFVLCFQNNVYINKRVCIVFSNSFQANFLYLILKKILQGNIMRKVDDNENSVFKHDRFLMFFI